MKRSVRGFNLGRTGRVLLVGMAATVALPMAASAVSASVNPSAAKKDILLFEESFRNSTTTPLLWRPLAGGGYQSCLTAGAGDGRPAAPSSPLIQTLPPCDSAESGVPDQQGDGALRLTYKDNKLASGVLLNKPFALKKWLLGTRVEFDMFQYDTKALYNGRSADGITFFLTTKLTFPPTVESGDDGGCLGYTHLQGAVVGVGFDNYGNFSDERIGRKYNCFQGGPGYRPNHVVVRSGEKSGYSYVAGNASPGRLAEPLAKVRTPARRHVVITMRNNTITTQLDYNDGNGLQTVSSAPINDLTLLVADVVYLGWSASTGAGTGIHEIRDVKVSALLPF